MTVITKSFLAQVTKERLAHNVQVPVLPAKVAIPELRITSKGLDCQLASNEIDSTLWDTTEDGTLTDTYWIGEFCRENEYETASQIDGIRFGRWNVSISERDVIDYLLDNISAKERASIDWEHFSLDNYFIHKDGYLALAEV